MIVLISFYLWKVPSKGMRTMLFKQKWVATISVLQLFTSAKTMVWEGLSLLALSSKLPMKTMLFKQNLSSKLPMRTMPLEQVDMAWEQAKKARLVDLKYVSLYRDLLQPLTSKQNLSSKIQLLWHIFTLKRLSYGIRFKTMLSMTKWASFS